MYVWWDHNKVEKQNRGVLRYTSLHITNQLKSIIMQSDALFLINLASEEFNNGNISKETFLETVGTIATS